MRRNRRNRRSDILIDLTSLLDVVFILLLVVLCSQQSLSAELQEQQAEADSQLAEAASMQADADLLKRQYKDMIAMENYMITVSISAPYDETTVTTREIRVLFKEDETYTSFVLNGSRTEEVLAQFREYLSSRIVQYRDRPVVISLNADNERILYRDELTIGSILSEIAGEHGNVYLKGSYSGG